MSKDVRPVYMGTFEKHKKDVENRLNIITDTQLLQHKRLDSMSNTIKWVVITAVIFAVALILV